MTRWRPSQELVVLVCYTTALYMTVVDNTIIYTALPSVARDFHASLADAQWVTLAYLLTLAMMSPSSGWIGDRFGTRRTFLLALALFTGASALCGLSGSLPQLVIFRVIQGVGGGLIIPVGQAMLFRAFPPARRARTHDASAVHAPPRCRSPVGEGAKRVRIIAASRSYRGSRVRRRGRGAMNARVRCRLARDRGGRAR